MYIITQSNKFNCLVGTYLSTNFQKQAKHMVKNERVVLDHMNIYSYKNCFIVSNTVLNALYNTHNDISRYSLLFTLYRNIPYRLKDGVAFAKLDGHTKERLYDIMDDIVGNVLQQDLLDDVYVIGRKYKNEVGKMNYSCFDVWCKLGQRAGVALHQTTTSTHSISLKEYKRDSQGGMMLPQRRVFSYELKKEIQSREETFPTMYTKSILSSSVFLDVEFLNDIVDDFKTFPVSKDMSMIFMAGVGVCDANGKFNYTDITVSDLTPNEQFKLLDRLMEFFEYFITQHGRVFVFHWSHADATVLKKALSLYQCLNKRFYDILGNKLHFIDLMKVFKSVSTMNSYSLKKVAKVMLNYEYDSECQNGFDAMMVAIEHFTDKKNSLSDIIRYNKIDTMLLYELICEGLQVRY